MRKTITFLLGIALATPLTITHAKSIRTLFIGNSYTEYNTLPSIINQIALTQGDTLIYESNTPGGHMFSQHINNTTTLNLINRGNWDYVVLQEQSQKPSFPEAEVINEVYPFAAQLCNKIREKNKCTQPVFYMTWGRKNGDSQNCRYFPPVCTYIGMDSLLQLRYTTMAEQNDAILSPVAKVWRAIRAAHPSIELYTNDESHPSFLGSYAAAATFYTILFKKDPTLTSYLANNSSTILINDIVKQIVFDSLDVWYQYGTMQNVSFDYTINNLTANFNNNATNYHHFEWNFGDGNNSTDINPTHTYTNQGSYNVTLMALDTVCNKTESFTKVVNIESGVSNKIISKYEPMIFPNPASNILHIQNLSKGLNSITIKDINGKIILREETNSNHYKLDITQLISGIYIVELQNEDGTNEYRSKFTKL